MIKQVSLWASIISSSPPFPKILNLFLRSLAGKEQDCSDVWLQPHTNGSALTALKLVEADLTTNH